MSRYLPWARHAYTGLPSEEPKDTEMRESLASRDGPKKAVRVPFTRMMPINVIVALLPSFVQNRIRKSTRARRLHKSSFLHGLRGVAALIVFFYHTIMRSAVGLLPAYKSGSCVIQLPMLRLLWAGPAMVHVFFVMSGYVLALKPVQLIRAGNFEKFSDTLFSGIIRRPFRLFIPSIVGILLFELTIISGQQHGLGPDLRKRLELLLYTWRWDQPEYFLKNLWTIPIEFSGSMLLFLTLIGLSRARTSVRLISLGLLMIHSLASGRWAACEFFGGILIAEVEAMIEEANEDSEISVGRPKSWEKLPKILNYAFWGAALIFGLLVAGWDHKDAEHDPVVGFLYPLIPEVYFPNPDIVVCFWFAFASISIVWALFRIPVLQKPFLTGPAQYLGDISYSLYIVHGLFPWKWQSVITDSVVSVVGGRSTCGVGTVSVLVELVALGTIMIWLSDLFMRWVDVKSVQFARWMETICRGTA